MSNEVRKEYEIYQVMTNPRSGEDQLHHFETHANRAEAVKVAKRELKKGRWQVDEVTRKTIATNITEKEAAK